MSIVVSRRRGIKNKRVPYDWLPLNSLVGWHCLRVPVIEGAKEG